MSLTPEREQEIREWNMRLQRELAEALEELEAADGWPVLS